MLLAGLCVAFSNFLCYPQVKGSLLVLIPWQVGLCTFQEPVSLTNELYCEAGTFSHHHNPHRFLQPEVLRLYFPTLESWVAWSVLLPSCSSQFIHKQMWDLPVHQPLPRLPRGSSHSLATSVFHPGCLSPPLLPVQMNVSSLTLWLSDFYIVRFSGSSGVFCF